MKHGTRSGYNKHNCRCIECRDWERDRKARYRARQRGEEPLDLSTLLVNGVLPPDDPETRAAYEMTHAAQNGTASPEVQARWDENMANRVAHPDEFGLTRHGTLTGYRQGCRGEACPVSPSCRTVAREYQKEYRRKQRGVGEFEHGTTTGYYARKCRCDECREAMREYSREYRRKRREAAGVQPSRGFSDSDCLC